MTIHRWTRSSFARARNAAHHGVRALLIGAFCLTAQVASAANRIPDLAGWRDSIAKLDTPGEGCFTAAYPKLEWERIACRAAPKITRARPAGLHPNTVGHGNDYVAKVTGLMSLARGTFPVTANLASEYDSRLGYADTYSLQINSQFISGAPICAGAAVPANCQAWEQFTFNNQGATSPNPYAEINMQYWLLDYAPPHTGVRCPRGWQLFSPDCVRNSKAVYLEPPAAPILFKYLSKLTMQATAVAGGNDKLVFLAASNAYSVAAKDDVIDLAQYWNAAEFNAFGFGFDSDAMINSGALIKVRVGVRDSTSTPPVCVGNSGTTGEGNNMTLGACTVTGDVIQFSESN